MPRKETVLYVLVGSPSDVEAERTRLEEVITELNHLWSRRLGIRLELVRWETHAHPGFSEDAQDVINAQLPSDYDVFIGILWHRFGTPTGRAESGTQEEFEQAKARWDADNKSVQLMFYFKDEPISPSQLEPVQLAKVVKFRKSLSERGGFVWPFKSTDDFANFVRVHLTHVVQEWESRLGETTERQDAATKETTPATERTTEVVDEEAGLIELGEIISENFADGSAVLERITKATDVIGKRVTEHTRRLNLASAGGRIVPSHAKRLISKAAKDMSEYAAGLELEIPILDGLLESGLSATSQLVSLWPDFLESEHQRAQFVVVLDTLKGFRGSISTASRHLLDFLDSVRGLPRLTTDLNRAKRSVSRALENQIKSFQRHEQVVGEIEKSASRILGERQGM